MQESQPPYYNPGPYGARPSGPSPYRWVGMALVGIIVVIALAVAVWFFVLAPFDAGGHYYYPFGAFFLVFIVIWISFMIVRMSWWSSRRQQRYNRQMYRQGGGGPMRDPALRTARMRYARGEITREQYEQIVHDISMRPPNP
jgi:uncharacterized membrane protein